MAGPGLSNERRNFDQRWRSEQLPMSILVLYFLSVFIKENVGTGPPVSNIDDIFEIDSIFS
jgi:hypothetical protein